ncbi:MAG: YlbF family regulator [Clostridiales bacterium]|nr:YlbF family regulator [Clostridiales bacterium]
MDNIALRAATDALATAIRESEEYRRYQALRDVVMDNDTNKALLTEYRRVQTRLQMAAVAGTSAAEEEVRRFQQLSALLYTNADMAQYLVAQLRMQQLTGEVFQRVADAAGLELELPGM